ncbi:hypothetical protein ElyMa_001469100 [Elysia marginata]|uniref:Uncharacterized protein n=1 Tax=Elysia marginata TaxID=1093978 RepID=A0AAV4J3R3_9GAST|nr:hypothetical protein ElyMa_001469100 [Elysia marginata]
MTWTRACISATAMSVPYSICAGGFPKQSLPGRNFCRRLPFDDPSVKQPADHIKRFGLTISLGKNEIQFHSASNSNALQSIIIIDSKELKTVIGLGDNNATRPNLYETRNIYKSNAIEHTFKEHS